MKLSAVAYGLYRLNGIPWVKPYTEARKSLRRMKSRGLAWVGDYPRWVLSPAGQRCAVELEGEA